MSTPKTIRSNQEGIVAIIVTLVIMIVLTLIVTGFAQLARREKREALDRQLSTQALYAAESGINDAQRLLKQAPYNDGITSKSTCDDTVGNSQLDATNVTQYTCLLINQHPETLRVQVLPTETPVVMPVVPVLANDSPAAGSKKLIINWRNKDNDSGVYTGSGFPDVNTWDQHTGMVRVDLVATSNLSVAGLAANTFTVFLKPGGSGASGTVNFSTNVANQGQVVTAKCVTSGKTNCTASITGLTGTEYYIRLKSIYNVTDVDFCATLNTICDGSVFLAKAQAVIDSTGRAADVLKRVQVRVRINPDLSGDGFIPDTALNSTSGICKLLSIWPGGGTDSCPTIAP